MKKEEDKKEEVVENIKINGPQRISFFKRIYMAIFKVEKYGEFVLEKTKIAVGYFFKLLFVAAVIAVLATTFQTHKMVSKGFYYLKNEMPDFTLVDGIINFSEDTEAYDSNMDFYVLYSTKSELSDSVLDDIEKNIQKYSTALVYLKDRVIYYNGVNYSYFKYSDLINQYNFDISNKQDLIKVIDKVGIIGVDISYFMVSLISMYIINIIGMILDIVLVFAFGIIAARLCGVSMPLSKLFSLSIYSFTLSILLRTLYSVTYTFTNFYIEYFDVMYILVAYIYLIAAILIIKSDIIKQKIELQKIVDVQKQVKKEIEEEKEREKEDNKKDDEDKKDNKKDNKKDDEEPVLNGEPDGSEI